MNRIQLIQALIPLLYDWSKTPKGNTTQKQVGSYGGKHAIEHLIDFYITNDEFIEACVGLGIPHKKGDPNYVFYMKSRFELNLHNHSVITKRPKWFKKAEWDAYLHAKEQSNTIVNNLIENVEGETRFQRLASVVGHHP